MAPLLRVRPTWIGRLSDRVGASCAYVITFDYQPWQSDQDLRPDVIPKMDNVVYEETVSLFLDIAHVLSQPMGRWYLSLHPSFIPMIRCIDDHKNMYEPVYEPIVWGNLMDHECKCKWMHCNHNITAGQLQKAPAEAGQIYQSDSRAIFKIPVFGNISVLRLESIRRWQPWIFRSGSVLWLLSKSD